MADLVPWVGGPPDASFGVYLREHSKARSAQKRYTANEDASRYTNISAASGYPREVSFLFQRIYVVGQRFQRCTAAQQFRKGRPVEMNAISQ